MLSVNHLKVSYYFLAVTLLQARSPWIMASGPLHLTKRNLAKQNNKKQTGSITEIYNLFHVLF